MTDEDTATEVRKAYEQGFVDGISVLSEQLKTATDGVIDALKQYHQTKEPPTKG